MNLGKLVPSTSIQVTSFLIIDGPTEYQFPLAIVSECEQGPYFKPSPVAFPSSPPNTHEGPHTHLLVRDGCLLLVGQLHQSAQVCSQVCLTANKQDTGAGTIIEDFRPPLKSRARRWEGGRKDSQWLTDTRRNPVGNITHTIQYITSSALPLSHSTTTALITSSSCP